MSFEQMGAQITETGCSSTSITTDKKEVCILHSL